MHALTPRESTALALAAEGLPDKTIAERMQISVGTSKAHIGSARRKLGARNRTHAAVMYLRRPDRGDSMDSTTEAQKRDALRWHYQQAEYHLRRQRELQRELGIDREGRRLGDIGQAEATHFEVEDRP